MCVCVCVFVGYFREIDMFMCREDNNLKEKPCQITPNLILIV